MSLDARIKNLYFYQTPLKKVHHDRPVFVIVCFSAGFSIVTLWRPRGTKPNNGVPAIVVAMFALHTLLEMLLRQSLLHEWLYLKVSTF